MKVLTSLTFVALLITGCAGDSSQLAPVQAVTPAPVSSKITFTQFVNQAVAQEQDAEPLTIKDDDLIFNADDDPTAFDSLIDSQI